MKGHFSNFFLIYEGDSVNVALAGHTVSAQIGEEPPEDSAHSATHGTTAFQ